MTSRGIQGLCQNGKTQDHLILFLRGSEIRAPRKTGTAQEQAMAFHVTHHFFWFTFSMFVIAFNFKAVVVIRVILKPKKRKSVTVSPFSLFTMK